MSFRHMQLGVLPIDERPIDHTHLKGIDFSIDKTWEGNPIDHDPINVRMEWLFEKGGNYSLNHKRSIKVTFDAPLFDDPEAPDDFPGICPGLWKYEVVELFFANSQNQYLEVEVGPHGHWLCLLHDGYRNCFNKGEELDLVVKNAFIGNTWRCTFEIPITYLPFKVNKFNAYAIHGTEPNRVYEALHPVTDGNAEEPDFHRLEYFQPIEMRRVVPDGFRTDATSDPKFGDLWGAEP
ncbi:hypothetical protein L596_006083 [Steinernema carpocapsae]|uniref:Uncharacterized protein n=1 Tax=Steinernema carpocapsae TaxID=34508 RepID=A0A4V6I8W1_STECR|nr:hypothetical protein L596_006083 [Steinernema carpocapsae]